MPPELHTSVDCHSASHHILPFGTRRYLCNCIWPLFHCCSASHSILPHQPTVSLDNLATVLPPVRRADIQFMAHAGAYKDTCALFLVTSSREAHYPKSSQARSFSFSLLFHQAISLQSCIELTVSPTNLSNLLSLLQGQQSRQDISYFSGEWTRATFVVHHHISLQDQQSRKDISYVSGEQTRATFVLVVHQTTCNSLANFSMLGAASRQVNARSQHIFFLH
jgi:hypothetical protein